MRPCPSRSQKLSIRVIIWHALALKHCEIHIYYNELSVSTVLVSIIFKTQYYMRNSYIVYAIKMQSVSKSTIFGNTIDGKKWSRILFEILPCGKEFIFVTQFVILSKSPPFYEVKWIRRKWLSHGGISTHFLQFWEIDLNGN